MISALLSKWKFKIVDPGSHSYEEQVQIFSNCDLMIGSHGAGFTNLLYAKSSSTIIELFTDKYLNLALQRLAVAKGMSYHYIVGETIGDYSEDLHTLEYKIDVDEVLGRLEQIIKNC